MLPKIPASKFPQPALFVLEESMETVELFPAVWSAVEDLTMPEAEVRHKALDRLVGLNAPRFSPVVAYMLLTRLTDPDLKLRGRVANILSQVLTPDEEGRSAPEDVRSHLLLYLSQLRTRQVFSLLQVIAGDNSIAEQVANLINACPYAGNHLIDILNDHKAPIEIRKQAAMMIGKVGFVDVLPMLEKLENRLEARLNGQKAMPFAPPPNLNEVDLLPSVQESIRLLRSP